MIALGGASATVLLVDRDAFSGEDPRLVAHLGADEPAERPNFFDVSVFGTTAENVERYLGKGSRVAVDGRLEWREWETAEQQKRQAVGIVADVVQFLDSPGEREGELVGAGSGGGEDERGF